jgi:hypothetical protein
MELIEQLSAGPQKLSGKLRRDNSIGKWTDVVLHILALFDRKFGDEFDDPFLGHALGMK